MHDERTTGMPMSASRRDRAACWRRLGWLAAVPLAAAPALIPATHAAADVKAGQHVIGWGDNTFGELGDRTTDPSSTPVFVSLPTRFRYTTVRTSMTSVALTTTGRVYGWGDNDFGQIGDGSDTGKIRPVLAVRLSRVKVTALREGGSYTLALTSTGKVLAWGQNSAGELGNGTTTDTRTPVQVKIPKGVTVTAISAGADNALALTKTGRVLSWGGNGAGQLGAGSTTARSVPGFVALPAHAKVASIAAGYQTGFAVTSTGRLLAWGFNADGQLGDGTTQDHLKPHQVHLPHGVKIAAATAGQLHALAATTTGRVLAWGFNAYGQLGNGTTGNQRTPVFVKLPKGTKVRALAAGQHFSMAMTTGGRILAWGRDNAGQLGIGSHANRAEPVRVHLPKGFTPTAIGAGWNAETALAIGHESIRD